MNRPTVNDILDAERMGYVSEGGVLIYLAAQLLGLPRALIEHDQDGLYDDALMDTRHLMLDTSASVAYDEDYSTATVTLGHPVGSVETVTLRRPTVRDRLTARKGGVGSAALISNLSACSDIAESVLRDVDVADWAVLVSTFTSFPARRTGGPRLAAGLGGESGG